MKYCGQLYCIVAVPIKQRKFSPGWMLCAHILCPLECHVFDATPNVKKWLKRSPPSDLPRWQEGNFHEFQMLQKHDNSIMIPSLKSSRSFPLFPGQCSLRVHEGSTPIMVEWKQNEKSRWTLQSSREHSKNTGHGLVVITTIPKLPKPGLSGVIQFCV